MKPILMKFGESLSTWLLKSLLSTLISTPYTQQDRRTYGSATICSVSGMIPAYRKCSVLVKMKEFWKLKIFKL